MPDERLREALETICRNDKTFYDYHGDDAPNRDGVMPAQGQRWTTPREIARAALAATDREENTDD